MPVTYNAGTNITTVTGYTEAVPCTFLDIYNADVAGGWGVWTQQCTNQFCSTSHLHIGDGSTTTWFKDTLKQIMITTASAILYVKLNATFQLGDKDANGNTFGGCRIHFTDPQLSAFSSSGNAGDVKLYDTTIYWNSFFRLYRGSSQVVEIDGCTIIKWKGGRVQGTNSFVKNTDIHDCVTYGLSAKAPSPELNNLRISRSEYGAYISLANGPNPTLKNVTMRNNTYTIRLHQDSVGNTGNPVFLNPDVDSWSIHWTGASGTLVLWRKHEFDLKVIDKDNTAINAATVKVWDKDSNLVVDTTTNASGVIATQTITRGYYNQANGNTLQEASPHLIKITKAGYTMYEADFTLEAKTDWTVALQTSILRNPSMTGGMA